MEDCVHSVSWGVWTHCDVFLSHKFAGNILDNDEWHIKRSNRHRRCSGIYGWCIGRNRGWKEVWWYSRGNSKEDGSKQSISKTREMCVES